LFELGENEVFAPPIYNAIRIFDGVHVLLIRKIYFIDYYMLIETMAIFTVALLSID
jgi:hypothetical protein